MELRPDPTENPDGYRKWLSAVSVPRTNSVALLDLRRRSGAHTSCLSYVRILRAQILNPSVRGPVLKRSCGLHATVELLDRGNSQWLLPKECDVRSDLQLRLEQSELRCPQPILPAASVRPRTADDDMDWAG